MKLTTRELTIFAMLGAAMYASKIIMEFAPNIHLLGVFTIAFTVVYRKKALYPIYIYVLLLGLFNGFPFDIVHGVSNFFCGILIVPIIRTLKLAERNVEKN